MNKCNSPVTQQGVFLKVDMGHESILELTWRVPLSGTPRSSYSGVRGGGQGRPDGLLFGLTELLVAPSGFVIYLSVPR